VVALPKDESSEQVLAAIIRPRDSPAVASVDITLDSLREDLKRLGLESHQLPTLLRVTIPSIPLPTGSAGKPGKAQAIKQYFPTGYRADLEREKA
jgi:hypothetical protein